MSTHVGKIGRLPKGVREELGRRIEDGLPSTEIVQWLNGQAEVQAALAKYFGGRLVNEQNMCEWRKSGHVEWLRLQEQRALAGQWTEQAEALDQMTGDNDMTDVLAMRLAVQIGQLEAELLDQTPDVEKRWKRLREINHELSVLRRDHDRRERTENQWVQWEWQRDRQDDLDERAREQERRKENVEMYLDRMELKERAEFMGARAAERVYRLRYGLRMDDLNDGTWEAKEAARQEEIRKWRKERRRMPDGTWQMRKGKRGSMADGKWQMAKGKRENMADGKLQMAKGEHRAAEAERRPRSLPGTNIEQPTSKEATKRKAPACAGRKAKKTGGKGSESRRIKANQGGKLKAENGKSGNENPAKTGNEQQSNEGTKGGKKVKTEKFADRKISERQMTKDEGINPAGFVEEVSVETGALNDMEGDGLGNAPYREAGAPGAGRDEKDPRDKKDGGAGGVNTVESARGPVLREVANPGESGLIEPMGLEQTTAVGEVSGNAPGQETGAPNRKLTPDEEAYYRWARMNRDACCATARQVRDKNLMTNDE